MRDEAKGKPAKILARGIDAVKEMGFPAPKPTASCERSTRITDRSMHLTGTNDLAWGPPDDRRISGTS